MIFLNIGNLSFRFPRLSIICKKFDEYTFDITSFDSSNLERITEKCLYFCLFFVNSFLFNIDTLINEDIISKSAKGKQFTADYDLLSYKIVFQLALKQDNIFMISQIKCETNIINEREYTPLMYIEININESVSFLEKTPTKGDKRKASSNDKMPKKRNDSIDMPMINPSKKFKSSVSPFTERPVDIFHWKLIYNPFEIRGKKGFENVGF